MKNSDVCIIFLKFPEAGRVKTRLGKAIGMEKAAEIYKKLAENAVKSIESDKYDLLIAIDSHEKSHEFKNWLGDYEFIAQTTGDLGRKMQNAFEYAFERGYTNCIITGSDIPELDSEMISEGFSALADSDAVLGKAFDGGYYLVGMSGPSKEYSIFSNMIWSIDTVLIETLKRLETRDKSVALLKELGDIDTVDDLMKFGDRFV
ncbi:TIGR04282 family arsenosugar biosynthesis glycosyltransferase [Seleniivibrio woodruffii]|uniref:TIGR04282 family arsenosugar biosynthesis glycosyltransferase n=1 Tax=Seleniivibrio woodruffii TaxID=1078050 RepID=UPI0026ED1D3C|nr:TIGR04282 family arsenosugar biosynthesis glycosyltransferase [Seleniivibrio woodruffii]